MAAGDHLKATKAHLSQEAVYGPFVEGGGTSLEVGRGAAPRPYLSSTDSRCVSLSSSSRPSSGSHRSGEGQFTSSVTLWGLAMKTLQNDHDAQQ